MGEPVEIIPKNVHQIISKYYNDDQTYKVQLAISGNLKIVIFYRKLPNEVIPSEIHKQCSLRMTKYLFQQCKDPYTNESISDLVRECVSPENDVIVYHKAHFSLYDDGFIRFYDTSPA